MTVSHSLSQQNNYQFTLDSFADIANGAADIRYACRYVDPWSLAFYTAGQNFFKENWVSFSPLSPLTEFTAHNSWSPAQQMLYVRPC